MAFFHRDDLSDLRSEKWQKAFQDIRVRAEQESLSNLVFVDSLRILNNVRGKRHIQLAGRRGTGKTSLLLKLYTEYLAKFKRDMLVQRRCEFLPVSIHIGKLSSIPLYEEESATETIQSPATQAASNFRRMIQMILRGYDEIDGLQKYVDRYALGPFTHQRAKRKLKELEKYLKGGENRIRNIERELSQRSAGNIKLRATASSRIQGNPENPISAELSSGFEAGKSFENEWAERVFATAQLSLREISNRLVDVVKSLRCKQMLLLIDEWSAGQNPLESQPFLLELMKPLFFSNPAISVKMAVVPEFYKEYDEHGLKGLEPHSGYFISINLDNLQPYGKNQDKAKQVMREIVSAHLRSQMRGVRLPRGSRIINTFFKDDKLFSEVVIASEGNIRDFLMIIVRIYQYFLNDSSQQSFSLNDVRRGIAEHFEQDKWRRVKNERLRSTFIELCSKITSREIRLADTPGQDESIANTLNSLRLLRLLHSSRESCIVDGLLFRFFNVDAAGYQYIRKENPNLFTSARLPRDPMPDANPAMAEIVDPLIFYSNTP